MNGDLRPLDVANGLLLGLVLAAPLIAPDLMARGVEALFILGAFQLRLADRRWTLRDGWRGWISHIRMAPLRLVPWAATAIVALIDRNPALATAILIAAVLGEALVYPLCTCLMAHLSRAALGAIALLLVAGCAVIEYEPLRLMTGFMAGTATCMVWLRGPDGEMAHLLLALAGTIVAIGGGVALPALLPFAWPIGVACAVLTLAHLSTLRRRPMLWHGNSGQVGARFGPRSPMLRSRP